MRGAGPLDGLMTRTFDENSAKEMLLPFSFNAMQFVHLPIILLFQPVELLKLLKEIRNSWSGARK